jgi:hypothetical protein
MLLLGRDIGYQNKRPNYSPLLSPTLVFLSLLAADPSPPRGYKTYYKFPYHPPKGNSSLLGLFNYFWIWIPNFSLVAQPLYEATKGSLDEPILTPSSLTPNLITLKKSFSQASSLHLPNPSKHFYLFIQLQQGPSPRHLISKGRQHPLPYCLPLKTARFSVQVMASWPPCSCCCHNSNPGD